MPCLASVSYVVSFAGALGVAGISLVSQISGAESVMDAAARESWVALLLVVIVIAGMTCLGVVVRKMFVENSAIVQTIIAEKTDLATRLREVEEYQRNEIMRMHGETITSTTAATEAARASTDALNLNTEALNKLHDKLQ